MRAGVRIRDRRFAAAAPAGGRARTAGRFPKKKRSEKTPFKQLAALVKEEGS